VVEVELLVVVVVVELGVVELGVVVVELVVRRSCLQAGPLTHGKQCPLCAFFSSPQDGRVVRLIGFLLRPRRPRPRRPRHRRSVRVVHVGVEFM